MFKVNLETELIRQNKSLVSAKELLLIQEFDKLGEVTNSDSLSRVFGETAAKKGGDVKRKVNTLLSQTKTFDQARVFHISQIEKLCNKYHLRFLPSVLFKGSIDKDTAGKISQFEIANGTCIKSWASSTNSWGEERHYGGSTYIAAPKGSFELQERPKDPLLFHQINEEYFYLIHKWGTDISLFRRALSVLSNGKICTSILLTILVIAGVFFTTQYPVSITEDGDEIMGIGAIGVFAFVVVGGILLGSLITWSWWFRFVSRNEWRSNYKD
jgi:hypothetical protein